jgi:[acyl-carrier-protein] S-malonyltransferase
VSGDRAAVEEAVSAAKTLKKVRRAVMLDVSAPFHCSLMTPAADALRLRLDELLDAGAIRPPQVPVVWNVEAEATDKSPAEIRDVLSAQVTSPVKWSQSVDYCVGEGVTEFLELGAGGVLAGLIKQHAPRETTATSCGTGDQIRELLAGW